MNAKMVAGVVERFLGRYCVNTRRAYISDLNSFAATQKKSVPQAVFALFQLSPSKRAELIECYKRGMAKTPLRTYRRRISSLRAICQFARSEGTLHERFRIVTEMRRSQTEWTGANRSASIIPSQEEVFRLRATIAADNSIEGLRDLALFDLIYFKRVAGHEVIGLKKHEIDLDKREIWLTEKLTKRICRHTLPDLAQTSAKAWLGAHPDPKNLFMFVRLNRGRARSHDPLSPQDVWGILARRSIEADLKKPLGSRALIQASIENIVRAGGHVARPAF